ncbi:hypothetical protein R50072_37810 [Simiduia litorea]|uniref:hypothetical protein n=1 Tax=Simiduia litorea TaxID=1435348 RepID=UPI0036F4131E
MLPDDRMPEAEVTLRLAMFIIENAHTNEDVVCAIDGAQVQVRSKVIFPILEFLSSKGWCRPSDEGRWQCGYKNEDYEQKIIVHSSAGEGDLVSKLNNGYTLRVESKKGPLITKPGSQEYPLIREAIGQLMTVEHANDDDILAVAVPESEKFINLAIQWRKRPLMQQSGIHIVTVNRHNQITGLENVGM